MELPDKTTRDGSRWRFQWSKSGLTVEVMNPSRARWGGVQAEVKVYVYTYQMEQQRRRPRHLYGPVFVQLMSTPERKTISAALDTYAKAFNMDWTRVMDFIFAAVIHDWREETPVVGLLKDEAVTPRLSYLVTEAVPHGETTILFGRQGSGKSTIAAAIALTVASGARLIPGWDAIDTGNVLYLDWETRESEVRARLQGLLSGVGLSAFDLKYDVMYRAMRGRVREQIGDLITLAHEKKAKLIILDSLGVAAGGDLSGDETAIGTMDALRGFGEDISRLCIAHHAKQDLPEGKKPTVYGSVFWEALARCIWLCEPPEEEQLLRRNNHYLHISHRKLNVGMRVPTFKLDITYDGQMRPYQMKRSGYVYSDEPIPSIIGGPMKVMTILEDLGEATIVQIAQEAGLAVATVTTYLSRLLSEGKVEHTPGQIRSGKGYPATWKIAPAYRPIFRGEIALPDIGDTPPAERDFEAEQAAFDTTATFEAFLDEAQRREGLDDMGEEGRTDPA